MARILIIDDRPVNRQFLTTLLGYGHHDLREASDGAEGLRIAREHHPDLIISDVLMPTMDGYEFVRKLRDDPAIGNTPVVFSTAHYLSRESQALALKCGVTSIIYKPCEPQVVLDIVAGALGGRVEPEPPAVTEPEDFDREHLQLLTNKLSEKAEQLRDAHGKLTALMELSTDLAKERDPVLLLDRICSVAREIIGTRWTMIVLLESNRKTVQHLGVAGIHLQDSPALRSALLENGVFKTVTQEGRTICLSDVTSTPTALSLPKGLPRAASLLVAPLVMRGHVDGWICLADKLGLDAFTEQDEQLAPALAAQMAVAYANARLYSDAKDYASKLEEEISERTRAEEKVRESEQRLRTVIENLSEGLVVSDLDGQLLNWNRAAMEIHGFNSRDECLLKLTEFAGIFELSDLDGSVLDLAQWPLPRIIRGERLHNLEVRIRRLDGDWNRVFNYGGTLIREQNGRLAAIVTMSDITDRTLAEKDRLLLAAIVKSSEDAIIGKNLDGTITSWNKGAEGLYGYSAEEIVGRRIAILIPPDHSDELASILERLGRGESIDQFETERITKEGNRVLVSLTISPIKNSSGQVVGASTIARDISQRKRAEEAVQSSEARYRALFEYAPDGIVISNPAGYYLDVNASICRMLGYARDELIGLHSSDIVSPAETPHIEPALSVLNARPEYHREWQFRRKDSSVFAADVIATAMPDGNFLGMIRDITERNRAEEALRASELRYRRLFESAKDGILILDAVTGQIVEANPFLIEMLGYSKDELLGKELWEIGAFKDIVASRDAFEELQQHGYIRYEDLPLKTQAGVSKQVEFVSNSYIAGRIRVIQCNIRDITARKRAEKALLESQERLDFALQKSHTGGWDLDLVDLTLHRTLEHDRIFGYSTLLPQWTYEIFLEHVLPEDRTEVDRRFREAVATQTEWSFECRIRRPDGDVRWIWASGEHQGDRNGKPERLSGIVQDITERKRAEEVLRSKNEELAATTQQLWQASKLATMGELAASIAHELNNPLATVGLRTESLLMQLPEESDQRKPLEIIAQEVDRMATLVNNLLQFSRRSHRQVSTLDPREEIATSVEFVHYLLRSHNIQVVREFADVLPSIQADRQQLRQLFLNLLTNASDAMPQGGKLTVRAGSNGFGDAAVAIDFADSGEGITTENLEKIWDPFFTTKPEGKGTGLGLAICRRIVEEHGGTISIQSSNGDGTNVHIVLPATGSGRLS